MGSAERFFASGKNHLPVSASSSPCGPGSLPDLTARLDLNLHPSISYQRAKSTWAWGLAYNVFQAREDAESNRTHRVLTQEPQCWQRNVTVCALWEETERGVGRIKGSP